MRRRRIESGPALSFYVAGNNPSDPRDRHTDGKEKSEMEERLGCHDRYAIDQEEDLILDLNSEKEKIELEWIRRTKTLIGSTSLPIPLLSFLSILQKIPLQQE